MKTLILAAALLISGVGLAPAADSTSGSVPLPGTAVSDDSLIFAQGGTDDATAADSGFAEDVYRKPAGQGHADDAEDDADAADRDRDEKGGEGEEGSDND